MLKESIEKGISLEEEKTLLEEKAKNYLDQLETTNREILKKEGLEGEQLATYLPEHLTHIIEEGASTIHALGGNELAKEIIEQFKKRVGTIKEKGSNIADFLEKAPKRLEFIDAEKDTPFHFDASKISGLDVEKLSQLNYVGWHLMENKRFLRDYIKGKCAEEEFGNYRAWHDNIINELLKEAEEEPEDLKEDSDGKVKFFTQKLPKDLAIQIMKGNDFQEAINAANELLNKRGELTIKYNLEQKAKLESLESGDAWQSQGVFLAIKDNLLSREEILELVKLKEKAEGKLFKQMVESIFP